MKTVYGWLVEWPDNRISIDLFFSSPEKFYELLPFSSEKEHLIKIEVKDTFDDLDYIPDNY